MNNVVLVSDVHWSDSVIHIHTSILFQILFPFRLLQSIEQCSLGCTVGPCVVRVNKLTPRWQVKKPGLGAEGSTCWSLAANFPRVFPAPGMQQHHTGSLKWLWGTYLHLQISQCCKLGLCSPWELFHQHRVEGFELQTQRCSSTLSASVFSSVNLGRQYLLCLSRGFVVEAQVFAKEAWEWKRLQKRQRLSFPAFTGKTERTWWVRTEPVFLH